MHAQQLSGRKRLIFILLAIALCSIFVIGMAEVAFRLLYGAPPPLADTVQKSSKRLFKPYSVMKGVIPEEREFTAHINSLGYRGREFQTPKPAGLIRILAIGDSFTFGVGANDDETIPALLESRLKAEGLNAEVINAGVGHSSPVTHYVNLRDIHLKNEPDLVVLFFDLTDLWDDWHSERQAVIGKDGDILRFDGTYIYGKRSLWLVCMQHSALCRYLNRKLVRTIEKMRWLGLTGYLKAALQGKRAKAAIINDDKLKDASAQIEYDGLLMMRGREKKELIDEHFRRTGKYLLKIRGLLNKHDIPLVIVMYPHGIYVGKDQWPKGRETWGFEQGRKYDDYYAFEIMESFTAGQGIPFINTLPGFLKAEKKKYFFDWDGHLNPDGNDIVASQVVNSGVFKKALKELSLDN